MKQGTLPDFWPTKGSEMESHHWLILLAIVGAQSQSGIAIWALNTGSEAAFQKSWTSTPSQHRQRWMMCTATSGGPQDSPTHIQRRFCANWLCNCLQPRSRIYTEAWNIHSMCCSRREDEKLETSTFAGISAHDESLNWICKAVRHGLAAFPAFLHYTVCKKVM